MTTRQAYRDAWRANRLACVVALTVLGAYYVLRFAFFIGVAYLALLVWMFIWERV